MMSYSTIVARGPTISRAPDRLPVYKAMTYTLNISLRFLGLTAAGLGTVERGDALLQWWARKIYAAGNGEVEVRGQDHFQPGQPYVVMSNHRSLLDIPALFLAVPASLRMVLKQELTRVPIWGRALVRSGFVPIDRSDHKKAVAQLEQAKERLSRGICIWIAPEGTRSRTGEFGSFKKGGFHLARQLGVPIIPTWIRGTDEMLPPDSFMVNYNGHARVCFGPPIPTQGRGEEDISMLVDEVRQAMLALT